MGKERLVMKEGETGEGKGREGDWGVAGDPRHLPLACVGMRQRGA